MKAFVLFAIGFVLIALAITLLIFAYGMYDDARCMHEYRKERSRR